MLVLNRKVNERILIGDDIIVKIVRVAGGNVRIGVEAPGGIKILREELVEITQPDGESGE